MSDDDGDDLKVLEYYIEYQEQGSSMAPLQVTLISVGYQMETAISDLKSNTTCLIRVFARSDIGNGSKSAFNATALRIGVLVQWYLYFFSDLICVIR